MADNCQHHFRVKAGMSVDLYVCTHCGYETRSTEEYLAAQSAQPCILCQGLGHDSCGMYTTIE